VCYFRRPQVTRFYTSSVEFESRKWPVGPMCFQCHQRRSSRGSLRFKTENMARKPWRNCIDRNQNVNLPRPSARQPHAAFRQQKYQWNLRLFRVRNKNVQMNCLQYVECDALTDRSSLQWLRNEFESGGGGTGPERKWGYRSVAKRRKKILVVPLYFFGCTSTIIRSGERYCYGQYSLVSFLFVVLLTVPPVPSHL